MGFEHDGGPDKPNWNGGNSLSILTDEQLEYMWTKADFKFLFLAIPTPLELPCLKLLINMMAEPLESISAM